MSKRTKLNLDPAKPDLAELLRTTMKARMRDQGLSCAALARDVGLSESAVWNLLAGRADGLLSTWSAILEYLDRDALETYATGSLSPSVLTRPLNPRIVFGQYSHDLTYSMRDLGVQAGVRIFQLDLPEAQVEDLLAGRAHFQVDRVLDRTGISFARPRQEQLGFPVDGQDVASSEAVSA